jgi:hypothetical protein
MNGHGTRRLAHVRVIMSRFGRRRRVVLVRIRRGAGTILRYETRTNPRLYPSILAYFANYCGRAM